MDDIHILKKFIRKNYPDPDTTYNKFEQFIGSDMSNLVSITQSSSNKSVIAITKDFAYKLMYHNSEVNENLDMKSSNLLEYNMEALPIYLDCEAENVICIKNISITPDISVIKYEKLVQVNKNDSITNILLLLSEIAIAFHSIHKYGYTHNDVYLDNIGIRKNGDYVLYDFELAKPFTNPSEDMFNDINIFFEDIIRVYESKVHIHDFLKAFQDKFHELYKIDSGKKKKTLKRSFTVYNYTYKIDDLKNILGSILELYINNHKNGMTNSDNINIVTQFIVTEM
jgi:tRNA A-37 threonylcarbamoyl transferase component Bud32